MTRRTRGISLSQLIEELKPYLIGWRGYFGFCQTSRVLTNLEAWIRRRLRSYLWRQWQNGHNRFNELRRRRVPKLNAAVAAGSPTGFWRMSGHPAVQQALRNHSFDSLDLPTSMSLSQLNPVEPPWYAIRMPGRVGGVAPRGVPPSRSSGIAVVATGCPAANCHAAACGLRLAVLRRAASVPGPASSTLNRTSALRRSCEGDRLADPGEEHQLGAGNFFPGG
jgi:hypothetical protein